MKPTRVSTISILISIMSFVIAFRSIRSSDTVASLGPRRGPVAGSRQSSHLGRFADSPLEIPARGWWAIFKRTAKKFSENELMSEAASVTFFALLSLFPAITALVSIYGLFADPSSITEQVNSVSGLVPGGGVDIIRDQIHRLTEKPSAGLGFGAVFGILAAVWSANQGAKAMLSALNDVYGEREDRGFIKLTATSLAFTIGGIAVTILGIGLIGLLPIVFKELGLNSLFALAISFLRWPLIVVVIAMALAPLYRFGPSRDRAKWRWITVGGLVGAIGWVALSYGFSWYVSNFGNYDKTYGSLGAIIGFMTWIWLSCTVLLLGAQLNAEAETQTTRDSTIGPATPIGTRGAAAADTVA